MPNTVDKFLSVFFLERRLVQRMQPQDFHPKYAKLNIGGSLFYTTIGTLTKHDTMLKAMFSGRMNVLTDTEGTFMKTFFINCV